MRFPHLPRALIFEKMQQQSKTITYLLLLKKKKKSKTYIKIIVAMSSWYDFKQSLLSFTSTILTKHKYTHPKHLWIMALQMSILQYCATGATQQMTGPTPRLRFYK